MRKLEKIILAWIKKELKARGFRVSAPDEGFLRVRFPKKQNQTTTNVHIRINSSEIVVACGWYCPKTMRLGIPLSRPDCVKQVICYLHQCRVHCICEAEKNILFPSRNAPQSS